MYLFAIFCISVAVLDKLIPDRIIDKLIKKIKLK